MIKQIIVMKALLKGIPVKLGTSTFRLFSPEETVVLPSTEGITYQYFFTIQMTKTSNSESSVVHVGCDMRLDTFINMCENLSLSEIQKLKEEIATK